MPTRTSSPELIATLVRELRDGNERAKGELVNVLYPELRRLAARQLSRERSNHTLQPTALVNELYLELLRTRRLEPRQHLDEAERSAFLKLAGQIMHRLLIHHARPLARRVPRTALEEDLFPAQWTDEPLHSVEDALSSLEALDPRFRSVVEMRVFEGLTGDEIAERLGCSPRTVATCWNFARNWLEKEWAGT